MKRLFSILLLITIAINIYCVGHIISGFSKVKIRAYNVGFRPSATDATNRAAWNSIPGRVNVYIDSIGTYNINEYLLWKSNTRYSFWKAPGCTIKKATGAAFRYVFINEKAFASASEYDINIIFKGNGLVVDMNNITSATEPVKRMRGEFNLWRTKNSEFDSVKDVNNNTRNVWTFECVNIDNVKFSHWNLYTNNNCFQSVKATNCIWEYCTFASVDDNWILDGGCYPTTAREIGDSYNNIVRYCTWNSYPGDAGIACATYAMSWANWKSGNTYQFGSTTTSNGKIYMSFTAGDHISTVAPFHITGNSTYDSTYSDAITWRFIQYGSFTEANIKKLIVKNCIYNNTHYFLGSRNPGNETFQLIYPETYGNGCTDSIIIDNIAITGNQNYFMYVTDYFKRVILKNITDTFTYIPFYFIKNGLDSASIEKIIIDSSNITITGNNNLVGFPTEVSTLDTLVISNSTITSINRRILTPIGVNKMVNNYEFTNSDFQHWEALFEVTGAINGKTINVDVIGGSVKNTPYYWIYSNGSINSTINYTSTGTYYEEPRNYLYYNNQVSTTLNIVTTGSLGDKFPSEKLKSGAGTIVNSSCDLVTALNYNIWSNGHFYELVAGNTAVKGALTWKAGKYAVFTADGTAGTNQIYQNITNALSNNIKITFRAKSPTATNTLSTTQSLSAILNPALTTEWQNYEFSGARGAASGAFYINLGSSLTNGTEIHIDEIQLIQY